MDNCHLCNSELFPEPILQLEGIPKAAQYYPEKNEFAEDRGITLTIQQCSGCGLVQHTMGPVEYFREVITVASLSEKSKLSRLSQMKDFADRFGLQGKKVLDIGSGKGEMLDILEETGMIAIGIEASSKSVEIGKSLGRKIVQGYIGEIDIIEGSPFRAFVLLNYLEHLPKPGRIIRNIYRNTSTDAVGFITVPNLDYLLGTRCFYEFVPDHISYFTEKTLIYAFEMNGFEVLECRTINEENDIVAIVQKRKALDLSKECQYLDFLIQDLKDLIAGYKSENKKVAVWGAGHRTLTLLALAKADGIEYVIDSAKFKQGKFTPITHLNIVPPEHLKKQKVDLVIVMVPGLYPSEVLKTLTEMDIGVEVAVLRDNEIEFI
jgi:SAM-dependent methyltransferase